MPTTLTVHLECQVDDSFHNSAKEVDELASWLISAAEGVPFVTEAKTQGIDVA